MGASSLYNQPVKYCLLILLFFNFGCAQEPSQLQARKLLDPAGRAAENICDESVSDGSEFLQGIIGGQSLKAGNFFSNSVVMILSRSSLQAAQNKSTLCTGLLITNDVILTAAHCVSDQIENMRVIFSNNIACTDRMKPDNTWVSAVQRTSKHESFFKDLSQDQKFDLALIQIKGLRPASYRPLRPRAVDSIRSGDQLVQVGYGVTDFNKGGEGRLRIIGKKGSQLTRMAAESSFFYIDQKSGGVCSGDSGGPLLRVTDKGLELVGVATAVSYREQTENPCSENGVYIDINPFLSWIAQELQGFRSSPNAK